MRTGGIDSSQIQAMIAQLKAHATKPGLTPPVIQTEKPAVPKAEFSDAPMNSACSQRQLPKFWSLRSRSNLMASTCW